MARPKADFDTEKVEAIKAYGANAYVNELIAWKQAELAAVIAAAVQQKEKEYNEEEWDKTYREELARARGAFGLAPSLPTKSKPTDIPD